MKINLGFLLLLGAGFCMYKQVAYCLDKLKGEKK